MNFPNKINFVYKIFVIYGEGCNFVWVAVYLNMVKVKLLIRLYIYDIKYVIYWGIRRNISCKQLYFDTSSSQDVAHLFAMQDLVYSDAAVCRHSHFHWTSGKYSILKAFEDSRTLKSRLFYFLVIPLWLYAKNLFQKVSRWGNFLLHLQWMGLQYTYSTWGLHFTTILQPASWDTALLLESSLAHIFTKSSLLAYSLALFYNMARLQHHPGMSHYCSHLHWNPADNWIITCN